MAPVYMAGQRAAAAEQTLAEAIDLTAELRYDEAAPRFEGLVGLFESAGDVPRAAEALFWLGFCREKVGRVDEARDVYLRVIDVFGDTPAARQAEARLAHLAP